MAIIRPLGVDSITGAMVVATSSDSSVVPASLSTVAVIRQTVAQALIAGATTLNLDAIVTDTAGICTTGVGAHITIAQAGTYLITFKITFDATVGGSYRMAYLGLNGTNSSVIKMQSIKQAPISDLVSCEYSAIRVLAANDNLRLIAQAGGVCNTAVANHCSEINLVKLL